LSAVFFIMGVVVGLLGKLGIRGTVDAFVEGFRSMTLAALLIGFARAISVVLRAGQDSRYDRSRVIGPAGESSHRPFSAIRHHGGGGRDSRAGPQCER
jgi:hypothetical protein